MPPTKTTAIVPHEENKIIPMQEANRLIKRTIFDMDDVSYLRVEKMAEAYALSTFNPKKDNKPQRTKHDYLLIMLKGMELGFSPMAAVDMISVIQGKPTLDGKGMLAIAYASNVLEDIRISGDEKACTVIVKRRGIATSFEFTFTINDAKAMGLLSKEGNNYIKQPKVMLKWRAVANCLREALPDFLGGLYTPEELASSQTIVWEDGSMEYNAPALPAQNSAAQLPAQASPDINNVDEMIFGDENAPVERDEWLEKVQHFCTPFYNNTPHRDNSIQKQLDAGYIHREMPPVTATAMMLMYCAMKPITDGGLELLEDEIYSALGNKVGEYLRIKGNSFKTAWKTLKGYDLRESYANDVPTPASDFSDIPF